MLATHEETESSTNVMETPTLRVKDLYKTHSSSKPLVVCGQLVHLFIFGEGPQEGRNNVKWQREDYGGVLFCRYGVQSL